VARRFVARRARPPGVSTTRKACAEPRGGPTFFRGVPVSIDRKSTGASRYAF
jgi:hypothetical protein